MAEDIAQDTFIRAFRGLGTFRGDSEVRSWLYRIATNLSLNAVTRRREYPADTLPELLSPDTPGLQAEASELRKHLMKAIEALPETLRRAVVLRELEHRSYEEIAADLDIPLNTVRTRILRGRQALRGELEQWR
jgi:RNA polymerase sigma-70 factor (ECF subfamily)